MKDKEVLVKTDDGILTITINRAEARNSLTLKVLHEMIDALDTVSVPFTRAVVLTGAGNDAFSAGADLKELSDNDDILARTEFFAAVGRLIEKIEGCPVPVIAKVRGYVLAGGCGIAAAADITVSSQTALFGLPEVGVGLAPLVVTAPLARIIGRKNLLYLALTGERVSAADAYSMGLVSKVVPEFELDQEVENLCELIKTRAPHAISEAKTAIIAIHGSQDMDTLASHSGTVSCSDEAKEGIAALNARRKPKWS